MMLGAAGIEGPERDARVLLAHVMDIDQAGLMARMNDTLPQSVLYGMDRVVAVRSLHQPVSHITGKRGFWNHEFLVNSDVLDPRPDTETLVAAALEQPFNTVLDLGTGSGAIVLSLLAERPQAMGVATDISAKALDTARRNAGRIGVADRVQFKESDWFESVSGQFDLIVSNPPYIADSEMQSLAPEVRDWEPHLALTPGGDGLSAYRHIAQGLKAVLAPGGRAFFEIGYRQAIDVNEIFTKAGFTQLKVLPDMSGHDRVIALNAP
ncbi:MAG: peptide chain release factor N(5)-glutamine methyltransferase [Rhodobacteraceae bacterium]|nr:peptide chain release factor N(5)-glutamine methyltransferase [Paracoccaceae bacterium]